MGSNATYDTRTAGTRMVVQNLRELLSGSRITLRFGEPMTDGPEAADGCFVAAVFREATVSDTPGVVGAISEFAAAEVDGGLCTLVLPTLSPESSVTGTYETAAARLLLVSAEGEVLASTDPLPFRVLQFTNPVPPDPNVETTSVYLTVGGVRYLLVAGLRGASPVLGLRNVETGTTVLGLAVPSTPVPAFDPNTATVGDETNQVDALSQAVGEMTEGVA